MVQTKREILETGAFLLGLFPQIGKEEFVKRILYYHGKMELPEYLFEEVAQTMKEEIEEYRRGGTKAVKKGLELGTLPYAPLYDRIKVLGQIIEMGKNGYREEKTTGKGDVVIVEVKNLQASLEAVKILNTLLEQFDREDSEEDYAMEVELYPQFNRL